MGNCIDHRRAASWADDDEGEGWEQEEMKSTQHYHGREEEDQEVDGDRDLLLGGMGRVAPSSSSEVKIRISKKQLEELLRQANVKGLSIQEALAADLVMKGEKGVCDHCRQWRPELHSIPEAAGDDA